MQVMQDSLGGNAKTLMFVNISPADYNQDETVTALTYATRVKLITNTAEKQQVSGGGCEKKKAFLEEKSPESVHIAGRHSIPSGFIAVLYAEAEQILRCPCLCLGMLVALPSVRHHPRQANGNAQKEERNRFFVKKNPCPPGE